MKRGIAFLITQSVLLFIMLWRASTFPALPWTIHAIVVIGWCWIVAINYASITREELELMDNATVKE